VIFIKKPLDVKQSGQPRSSLIMISRIAVAFLALPALAAGFTPSFVPALGGRVALRAAATSAMSSARVSCPGYISTGLPSAMSARLGRAV